MVEYVLVLSVHPLERPEELIRVALDTSKMDSQGARIDSDLQRAPESTWTESKCKDHLPALAAVDVSWRRLERGKSHSNLAEIIRTLSTIASPTLALRRSRLHSPRDARARIELSPKPDQSGQPTLGQGL